MRFTYIIKQFLKRVSEAYQTVLPYVTGAPAVKGKISTLFISSTSPVPAAFRNYPYDRICILTLKTENNSILSGIEKVGNHLIRNKRDGKGVLFTTARKFKGLEADVIIIVDVEGDSFDDDENKRLFYVGSSRAKHQLDILFVGDDIELKKAEKGLSDQNFPNAKIGIARCLNIKPMMAKE